MSEERLSVGEEQVVGLLRTARSALGPPRQRMRAALEGGTDRVFTCESPLGRIYVGAGARGVRLLGRSQSAQHFARDYRRRFRRMLSEDAGDRELVEMVERALGGEEVEVPLDLGAATTFQRRVLEVVRAIPRGEVRPYVWVAREAGSPGASRAVGSVMAGNPIPLLIPCHRVVRNDGATGNYAFGASVKVELLKEEGVLAEELARAPYVATPSTGVFCHATCRNARRIKPENRRHLRSAEEALAAGYRPCRVCRPVV